jgi:2-polyprenyl-3-methyl-5-hydroxy-6-metoxy-1,4-benzoquinol methylase
MEEIISHEATKIEDDFVFPFSGEEWIGNSLNMASSPIATVRACLDGLQSLAKDSGLSEVTYLDVGCGDGRFVLEMAARRVAVRTVGVDLDASHIEKAIILGTEFGPSCEFQKVDFFKFDFDPFNMISCYVTREAVAKLSKLFTKRMGGRPCVWAVILYPLVDRTPVLIDETYRIYYYVN